jgi:hypothetical protein
VLGSFTAGLAILHELDLLDDEFFVLAGIVIAVFANGALQL